MQLPKKLSELSAASLKGKRVIVRCDFNVPVNDEGGVVDDLRIRKTLHTISFLREAGACIILISHIEGKKASLSGGIDSLEPVANHISEHHAAEFGLTSSGTATPLVFIKDYLTDAGTIETKQHILNMSEGEVVLFENLRIDAGEKKNDPAFAAKLAQYADIYVNDAFAVSHRAHASLVALPALLPHYAGIQLISELEHLSKVFNPPRPFVFILGGAKFETKLPLIQKFLGGTVSGGAGATGAASATGNGTSAEVADAVFLGGALLNDVLKAKGFSVGRSLVSKPEVFEKIDFSAVISNPKLVIPDDVVVQEGGDSSGGGLTIAKKLLTDIAAEDIIMDVGPSFTGKLKEALATAKFVLWNGPMGNCELGFKEQTIGMARALAESGVQAALGGGDTTAAVAEIGLERGAGMSNIFVSTGGGAMLEYLQNETLPGVEALK